MRLDARRTATLAKMLGSSKIMEWLNGANHYHDLATIKPGSYMVMLSKTKHLLFLSILLDIKMDHNSV